MPSADSIVRLRAIRQLTGRIDPPCHPLTSPDAAASTASRPASVTIAIRPSVGRDGGGYRIDLGKTGTEIFLQRGLDSNSVICPSGALSHLRSVARASTSSRANELAVSATEERVLARVSKDGRVSSALRLSFETLASASVLRMRSVFLHSACAGTTHGRVNARASAKSRRATSSAFALTSAPPSTRLFLAARRRITLASPANETWLPANQAKNLDHGGKRCRRPRP